MAFNRPTTIEATFTDLSETYEDLIAERSSPKDVREHFEKFLQRAYWLTERAAGGNSREGGILREELFTRSAAAKACFELRNALHNTDLRLGFTVKATTNLGQVDNIEIVGETVYGEEETEPSRRATFPGGVMFLPCDPKTGEADLSALASAARQAQFLVVPQRENSETCLAAAGTRDVHALATECFSVLKNFYESLE